MAHSCEFFRLFSLIHFLKGIKHPRYRIPDQVVFSEEHTHLLLLMEDPAIISLPTACLASLWEDRRADGRWTQHELDYRGCDQELALPGAGHLLRGGQEELSIMIMAEMGQAVRGRYLVRRMQAHRPTWLDMSRVQLSGVEKPFTLTLIEVQVYSQVSNRIARFFLHFCVDSLGGHLLIEQEKASFSNIEPEELLCPISRQGLFVTFQNYAPFASKLVANGIHRVELKNKMRKTFSWDMDYYCGVLTYIARDSEKHFVVNYDRYD